MIHGLGMSSTLTLANFSRFGDDRPAPWRLTPGFTHSASRDRVQFDPVALYDKFLVFRVPSEAGGFSEVRTTDLFTNSTLFPQKLSQFSKWYKSADTRAALATSVKLAASARCRFQCGRKRGLSGVYFAGDQGQGIDVLTGDGPEILIHVSDALAFDSSAERSDSSMLRPDYLMAGSAIFDTLIADEGEPLGSAVSAILGTLGYTLKSRGELSADSRCAFLLAYPGQPASREERATREAP
jgi:hypothetical protein